MYGTSPINITKHRETYMSCRKKNACRQQNPCISHLASRCPGLPHHDAGCDYQRLTTTSTWSQVLLFRNGLLGDAMCGNQG